ncbi:LysR family transcriptional regulator [Enterobacteriaceae bacterium LUAb1]
MTLPFTLLQLEAFVCVCEHGNITRAASKLKKDRTTVSELIASLEDDLGYLLFDRHTRPLLLTAQGKRMYRQARLFLHEARAFSAVATNLASSEQQLLRLSYDIFTPREVLVRLISVLEKSAVTLDLRCEPREQAEAALLEGRCDVGLFQALNRPISGNLSWRTVGAIELNTYASPALFTFQPVSLITLVSYPQLLPWQNMPPYLAERLQISDSIVQINDIELLMMLMAAGKGWALLPISLQADKREGIVSIKTAMGNSGLFHPMVALWPPGQSEHPATKLVLDQLACCFTS